MQNTIAAALAVIAGSAISAGALARQAAPEPAAPPATVEVKASAETLRRNDTASRTVVTHEELVKYGDRSVLDALKRLPGVTVRDGGVRMRGLGKGYTQVLVDGERPPAGFSLEALAPEAIEKIEVIRAATAEYSTQSIAGTINIILRKTTGRNAGELKLGFGGGAGSRAPGITVGRSGKRGNLSHTLGATLSRNVRAFGAAERESARGAAGVLEELRETRTAYHQSSHALNLNARLGWAFGEGDSLTWQSLLSARDDHGTEDNRTSSLAGPAYPYPQLPAGFNGELRTLSTSLALDRRLATGARLEARLGLKNSRSERSLWRQGFSGGAMVLDTRDTSRLREQVASGYGKYLMPLAEGHAFAFGWDAGRERFRERDLRRESALGALGGAAPINFDKGFATTSERLALYAQDEWDVRPGWSVYLGARWEGMRVHTTGDGFAPVTARFSVFSPLAQALWKIPGSGQDQLRLALTRTYRAPPLTRLLPTYFYTTFNTEVSPDFLGNPHLRPELATGVDAAYEHYFTAGGLVSLSASTRAIRDFMRNEVSYKNGRWVATPVNGDEAKVASLALEARLPMKTLGRDWPLELRASLARNWSNVDSVPGPDNRLDRQPRWTANLGADYSKGAIAGGASFSFVSGGWTRSSVFQSAYSGPARDLEAYALYRFGPLRQLRFTAGNLLAPARINASVYADAGGTVESATVGRSYRTWRLQYEQKFQAR